MPDLLLELFSEEIPARMQDAAAADLIRLVTNGMVDRGLTYAHAEAFATPRRLVLAVEGLADGSPAVNEERKGPRVGAPEKALEGFLRSTGLTKDQLEVREVKGAEVYFAVTQKPGRTAEEIVAEVVDHAVRNFPWPKSMRWGAGTLRWVRPLHSILCILSDESESRVVGLEIDGIKAGSVTRGHRFMAPDAFSVSSFEDYQVKLARAKVKLSATERQDAIWHDATQLAFAQGLEVVEDRGLLREVAGLVEWPVVLLGKIEERFLDLPPEVLQTSMKEHQKFLSVREPESGKIVAYIVVANRETADAGATILDGNARVLAARLSDAVFFWENDLRTPLEDMTSKLDSVTFHNKLGTQGQRIGRVASLARQIAPDVGADPGLAERAAHLAKADLSSEMVYEFPELQGTMGYYYALRAGEDGAVASAAAEHYSPLGPSDVVPTAPISVAVALADKLDMLTGFWSIEQVPTGSKDPYALRRAALGAIRLILESNVRIKLRDLIGNLILDHKMKAIYDLEFTSEPELSFLEELRSQLVASGMRDFEKKAELLIEDFSNRTPPVNVSDSNLVHDVVGNVIVYSEDLLGFFADRLKVYLRDEGIRHDVIDACFALGGQDDLVPLVARVRALQEFLGTDDAPNLLAGYRRAVNILEREEKNDGIEYSLDPDINFAETDSEKALFAALDRADADLRPALAAEDYAAAMTALSALRGPIDAFFEDTKVNADSPTVRRNRLCLLNRVRRVMNQVAVFSSLDG
ncbi:glycine--tRNA ligase subunit beta [Amaricoccus tamworthensis]|uniref:glycine--tRNA ligase subunit beta n=1 Tax=Amaricoccus tamworthensis TaxID=57002 RepID=UPI003C7E1753